MKFLIDAQLPRRLVAPLRQAGLDAIHTLDLPDGNRTADRIINERADEQRGDGERLETAYRLVADKRNGLRVGAEWQAQFGSDFSEIG